MQQCRKCHWLREVRPDNSPVAILRWQVQSSHKEVYEELKRIEGEEMAKRKSEEQEIALLVQRAQSILAARGFDFYAEQLPDGMQEEVRTLRGELGSLRFQTPPETQSHCAVHEQYGVFYPPSMRDWAGVCETFQEKVSAGKCSDCQHYSTPTGDEQDRSELNRLINTITISDPSAISMVESRKSTVEQSIGPSKALDIALAYDHSGALPSHRKYLSFCDRHSAVPEMFNRFGGCVTWAARGVRTREAGAAPQPREFGPEAQANAYDAATRAVGASPLDAAEFAPAGPARAAAGPVALAPLPTASASPQRRTSMEKIGVSPFSGGSAALAGLLSGIGGQVGTQGGGQSLVVDALGLLLTNVLGKGAASGQQPAPAGGAAPDESELPEPVIQIVAPGRPPLTTEMARRSVAVASAAFGTAMSATDRERYQALVVGAWREGASDAMALQLQLIGLYPAARVGQMSREQAWEMLQRFLQQRGGTQSAAPRSADMPVRDRTAPEPERKRCKCGTANAASRLFCENCGKPLK